MKHTKVVYLLTKVLAILFSSEKNETKDFVFYMKLNFAIVNVTIQIQIPMCTYTQLLVYSC